VGFYQRQMLGYSPGGSPVNHFALFDEFGANAEAIQAPLQPQGSGHFEPILNQVFPGLGQQPLAANNHNNNNNNPRAKTGPTATTSPTAQQKQAATKTTTTQQLQAAVTKNWKPTDRVKVLFTVDGEDGLYAGTIQKITPATRRKPKLYSILFDNDDVLYTDIKEEELHELSYELPRANQKKSDNASTKDGEARKSRTRRTARTRRNHNNSNSKRRPQIPGRRAQSSNNNNLLQKQQQSPLQQQQRQRNLLRRNRRHCQPRCRPRRTDWMTRVRCRPVSRPNCSLTRWTSI
jgi:hypothetical protein